MTQQPPVISIAETRRHGVPDDLWMVIDNNVYNVTEFAKVHPGGLEVLYDCGGVDATEAFEEVGHSRVAVEMLKPMLVGRLPSSECLHRLRPLETAVEVHVAKLRREKKDRAVPVIVLVFFVVVAVMGVASLQRIKWVRLGL